MANTNDGYKKLAASVILQAVDDHKRIERAMKRKAVLSVVNYLQRKKVSWVTFNRVTLAGTNANLLKEHESLKLFFTERKSSLEFFCNIINIEPDSVRSKLGYQ